MSYPGSKAGNGVWQRIIGQMPPHDVYVECFFGSGHVFHQKRRAAVNVGIDADAGVLKKFCPYDRAYVWNRGLPPFDITTPVLTWGSGVFGFVGNCVEILPQLSLPESALVYADPPYLLSTRQMRLYYDHEPEVTDPDFHTSLLACLQALKCRVIISHPVCELYEKTLLASNANSGAWRRESFRTRYRGRTALETIWLNFPEPDDLHDWRFAGHNHRQRTSLKRLRSRWLAKLRNMKARQRNYVLNAIRETYSSSDATSGA